MKDNRDKSVARKIKEEDHGDDNEEEHEANKSNSDNSFDEKYLDALNESIVTTSPEKLRGKEQELFEATAKAKGLNTNVFSAATDVLDMMKPGNGIKIKSRKMEVGQGNYVNQVQSKMSLN